MTASIEDSQDLRLASAPSNERPKPFWLPRVAASIGIAAAVGGVGCLAAAFSLEEWRTAMVGSTLIIVAGVAGAVWCFNRILADRHEFYQRGKADGWYEGWRGQMPTEEDPLIRH